jgi:hypothetical protein
MTEAELITTIMMKVDRADRTAKREFGALLRSSTKPELQRILKTVYVTRGRAID